VDCVVNLQIATYYDYSKLEEQLRVLGFHNDTSENAPICRKIYNGIIVDFMPISPDIFGFSNAWYKDGVENKIEKTLPDGTIIYIFAVEYYVATKFEALKSRSGTDIRSSHDWEDIVYVLDNCDGFTESVKNCSNPQLIEHLNKEFDGLLKNRNIKEIIYSALPYGAEEEHVDKIVRIISQTK
jgi:hypothetical protein